MHNRFNIFIKKKNRNSPLVSKERIPVFFFLQSAPRAFTVKDVQSHAVTTVLETDLYVIISLVLVTWAVIQDIRVIYVHTVRFIRVYSIVRMLEFLLYISVC